MTQGDDHDRDLRALGGLVVCTAVVAALLASGLVWAASKIPHVRHTEPAFVGLTDRPPRATGDAAGAMNILLLGTDRRSGRPTTGDDAQAPTWLFGEQRSDTIMLVHVSADRRSAYVVSLPRDSWVRIPGHGPAKLNAAYSWGGLPLTVATIEQLTRVRIDHVALVDWEGFASLVDTVGGVRVDVAETVSDSANDQVWAAGEHLLDGADTLTYVRQRYGLPEGDLDRVRRQQAVLRELVRTSLHAELRSDLGLLTDTVDQVLRHVSVDETWSLREIVTFAWSLRDLRTADIGYLTAPTAGLGNEGGQSVVHLDRRRGSQLWAALREDRTGAWLEGNADLRTAEVVR